MRLSCLHKLWLVVLPVIVSACVTVQPTVPPDTPLDKTAGYVAGSFTRSNSGGFGFVLTEKTQGTEYVMPIGEDSSFRKDVQNQILMIKVPPGTYSITSWVTYATLTKERSSKRELGNKILARPFEVKPGAVIFIGSHAANTVVTSNYPYIYTNWSIKANPLLKEADAQKSFAAAYPTFATAPFTCTYCVEGLIDALLHAAPLDPANSPAETPADKPADSKPATGGDNKNAI